MDYRKLKLTKKDFEEIDEGIRKNKEERMKFIEFAAEWLKKTPNKVWSKQQKKYC